MIKKQGKALSEVQNILKTFSELRDSYDDIETVIEAVCISTKLDQEKVLGILSASGVYVLPNPKEEYEIKHFISSVDRDKTANELVKEVGFRFCISNRDAKRLVDKWSTVS